MKKSIIFLGLAATLSLAACVKKPVENPVVNNKTANEVHFKFDNYFGDQVLELSTTEYTNMHGEKLNIDIFNYWITNIKLVRKDGTEYTETESYRLVRGNKGATHHFHLANVPAGTYTGVKFMIGVDVERNTSGAQTGDLDPTLNADMYWTWSTGYIQAKMEGTSPASTAPNNKVAYHIAGVEQGEETPREVTLSFGKDMVVGEQAGSIKIKTDAAKWFGGKYTLKIADLSGSLHGGAIAAKIADNLPGMFSITTVTNE